MGKEQPNLGFVSLGMVDMGKVRRKPRGQKLEFLFPKLRSFQRYPPWLPLFKRRTDRLVPFWFLKLDLHRVLYSFLDKRFPVCRK